MQIKNIEGLTLTDIRNEIDRGGKFVFYSYTVSVFVMTFKRTSDIFFLRAHENAALRGASFTALSAVAGWWGIPWGPIYTIQSLAINLGGGKNVTTEVMENLGRQELKANLNLN